MDVFSDLRPVPLDVILSWPTSNYVNPERRGPALLITNCVLLPLAMIILGLRLYTRLRIVHSGGLDDLFITLASVSMPGFKFLTLWLTRLWIPAIGLSIAVCLATTSYGWDLHIWDVPEEDIVPSRQVTFTAQFLFVWATNLTKISILLFYRRMSAPSMKKAFHYSVWATMTFVVLYTISITTSLVTACSPPRAFWDISIPHQCNNERAFELVAAILNIIVDFVIILLPLPTVWSLRLPKKQKWALTGIFTLGFLVCAAGIIRVYYVDVVVNKSYDTTWEGFLLWIFVALEVDIGLICASAPTLKPLFKRHFNTTNASSDDHEHRRCPSKTSGGSDGMGELETGMRFQKPMELNHLANSKPDGNMQKAMNANAWHRGSCIVTKIEIESDGEESIIVLQQVDEGSEETLASTTRGGDDGQRTLASQNSWGRKEPWSGV